MTVGNALFRLFEPLLQCIPRHTATHLVLQWLYHESVEVQARRAYGEKKIGSTVSTCVYREMNLDNN